MLPSYEYFNKGIKLKIADPSKIAYFNIDISVKFIFQILQKTPYFDGII